MNIKELNKKVREILWDKISIDKLTRRKNGTWIAKKGFVYRTKSSKKKFISNIIQELAQQGIIAEISKTEEHYNSWRNSWWKVYFKIKCLKRY